MFREWLYSAVAELIAFGMVSMAVFNGIEGKWVEGGICLLLYFAFDLMMWYADWESEKP